MKGQNTWLKTTGIDILTQENISADRSREEMKEGARAGWSRIELEKKS